MVALYVALIIAGRRTFNQVPAKFKAAVKADLEALGLYRIYHCADKVGRKQVGRELDAAKLQTDGLCK